MSPENAIQDRYDAFEKAMDDYTAPLIALIRLLTDPSPCRYDHRGNCQAHALHPRPCPHELAKELLAKQP